MKISPIWRSPVSLAETKPSGSGEASATQVCIDGSTRVRRMAFAWYRRQSPSP